MARVTKSNVVKKQVEVKEKGIQGIKEESPKGELFFKIVLITMAVAIFAVIIYFVVDALISNNDDEVTSKYNSNNYVTVTEINQIKANQSFELIKHAGLRYALDQYENVYVFYFNEDDSTLSETYRNIQKESLAVVDQLFNLETAKEKKIMDGENEFTFIILNDNTAFFFVNTSSATNSGWQSSIDTSKGQASEANVGTLLEIKNGEDLNWFGPTFQVEQNKTAKSKLDDILANQ